MEKLSVPEILDRSKTFPSHGYPEPLENSPLKESGNGAMKPSAKNPGGGSIARVTAMTPSPTHNHKAKKCPKCGAVMKGDKHLGSGVLLSLLTHDENCSHSSKILRVTRTSKRYS